MRNRKHGKLREAPELDITAFLNLMVVLVPFLLVSAVFSRITILQLDMPPGAGGGVEAPPEISIEVVIRQDVLEISDGRKVILRFPMLDNPDPESVLEDPKVYDFVKLTNYLLRIKDNYPDKTDAFVLMEPDIEYRHLIKVMDAMRSVEIALENLPDNVSTSLADEEASTQTLVLFPDISIGDAP